MASFVTTECPVFCDGHINDQEHSGSMLTVLGHGGRQVDVWPIQRSGEGPLWVVCLSGPSGDSVGSIELDDDQVNELVVILGRTFDEPAE